MQPRIYLSPPHMGAEEFEFVREAFATNWIAPAGPHVEAFEKEFAALTGSPQAVALSSGTAALHLALRMIGAGPGDEVICSDLTFAASANPIVYQGARPVFVDCDRQSWNMDPARLAEALKDAATRGVRPKAVILVHLYGQSADIDAIAGLCAEYEVPLIEDAAEALGAVYFGTQAPQLSEVGSQLSGKANQENSTPMADFPTPGNGVVPGTRGVMGIYSFNGNKIITTSGGGMLVTAQAELAERARYLATQARDRVAHYEHTQVGFNYRLSNVLAGIGRGQLRVLEARVRARRANFAHYRAALAEVPGIEFMPEASYGRATRWLTCVLIDPATFGADRETVRRALEAGNIEARPVWKPMHLQPVFAGCRCFGGETGADLFARGLCLPSGSNLTPAELQRVVEAVRKCARR